MPKVQRVSREGQYHDGLRTYDSQTGRMVPQGQSLGICSLQTLQLSTKKSKD